MFNRTLIKAAHLPHRSVGGGAPPLFLPRPFPLPRLPYLRLADVGRLASADARAPDIVPVGGACCDARGGACLASRLGFVGVDKIPGGGAEAGLPRAHASSSFLLLPLSLFGLEAPCFAGSSSLSGSFCCALSPGAAFPDASTTQSRLEPPRRESKHGPRPSSRTVRARRRMEGCRCGRNGGTRVRGGIRR